MNGGNKVAVTDVEASLQEQRDELARKLDKANRDNLLLMQVIQKADITNPKLSKESGRVAKDASFRGSTDAVKSGSQTAGAKVNWTAYAQKKK